MTKFNIDQFTTEICLPYEKIPKSMWTQNFRDRLNILENKKSKLIKEFREKNKSLREYSNNIDWYEQEESKLTKKIDNEIDKLKKSPYEEEKKQVLMIIQSLINDDYPIHDARVMLLVKEFLRTYLINTRVTNELMQTRMLYEEMHEDFTVLKAHPLLRVKTEFGKLYIELISKLDAFKRDIPMNNTINNYNFHNSFENVMKKLHGNVVEGEVK